MADLIPIESNDKTIQSCLKECLYTIPDFQRPYSWSTDELEEYWSDVVLAKSDFFFGATVTYLDKKRDLFRNTYAIIDGQQRLTTSVVALSTMRDFFTQLAADASNDADEDLIASLRTQTRVTQQYLITHDDDDREFEVLSRREPMFRENILDPNTIPSNLTTDHSGRLILEARKFFEGHTKDLLDSQVEFSAKFDTLKQIRNNILKARLIQIELTTEEDAALVFETLNARGAQLLLADLVKNLLVRNIGRTAADRRAVGNRWTRMVANVVGEMGSLEDADRFIWSSWASHRDAVTMRELFKAIKSHCEDGGRYEDYLSELEADASVYSLIIGTSITFPSGSGHERVALADSVVQNAIAALRIFTVTVATPAVMAILRKYDNSTVMKTRELHRSIQAIENFHFQFTQLAKTGSTGGTRGRYNKFAMDLMRASSRKEVEAAVDDLQSKLTRSLPSRVRAVEGFSELIYAPQVSLTNAEKRRGSKILISYVLLRLAHHDKTLPRSQNWASWTIEHIKPQTAAENPRDSTDPVFSIGNLCLLSPDANGALGDRPFVDKRQELTRYTQNRDKELCAWLDDATLQALSAQQLLSRTKKLAELAVDEVWCP